MTLSSLPRKYLRDPNLLLLFLSLIARGNRYFKIVLRMETVLNRSKVIGKSEGHFENEVGVDFCDRLLIMGWKWKLIAN